MRLTKFILIWIFVAFGQNILASPNKITIIKDDLTANSLLGERTLYYHVQKRTYSNTMSVVKSDKVYRLQTKKIVTDTKLPAPTNSISIDGTITEIYSRYFKFSGTIKTQLDSDKQKKCSASGTFYFAFIEAKGKKSRWRLLQNQHTCGKKIAVLEFPGAPNWSPKRPSSTLTKWGIGMITKDLRTDRGPFKIIFPARGTTTLYDKPKGVKIALANINLQAEKFLPRGLSASQLKYHAKLFTSILILRNHSVSKVNIHPLDIIKMKSGAYAVKVFKVKDGYLKILPATMKHPAWVSIKDLAKQGYQFSSWRDFLLGHQTKDFEPSGPFSINVRANAGEKAKKVTLVQRGKFKIKLTGQTKGTWMEVAITRLSSNCRKVEEKWKGWIKTLDDTGYPNIQIRSPNRC